MAKEVIERRLAACAIYLCSRKTPLIAGSASCKIIHNVTRDKDKHTARGGARQSCSWDAGMGSQPILVPRASLKQAEFRSKREPEEFSCEPSAAGSLYIY